MIRIVTLFLFLLLSCSKLNIAPSAVSYVSFPAFLYLRETVRIEAPRVVGGKATKFAITPALPAGLVFSTKTGEITGTPSAVSAARDYTVTASNSEGNVTTVIRIEVRERVPQGLTYSQQIAIYFLNVTISDNLPSLTSGTASSFSIDRALPAGLTFDTVSGAISGTPTTLSAASNYTVTATNSVGSTSYNLRLSVVSPSPTAFSYSPSALTLNRTVAMSPLTPSITGTVTSYTVSPSLPAGLSINASSGVISGTPTTVTPTASYYVTATNTGGTATTVLQLTVIAPQPNNLNYLYSSPTYYRNQAIPPNLPSINPGDPLTYSVFPQLPAGLLLNTQSGAITGIPTSNLSTTTYTVNASNVAGTVSTTLSITIVDEPPNQFRYENFSYFLYQGQSLPNLQPFSRGGAVTSYSATPAFPGGLGGLRINSSTGVISGTPPSNLGTQTYTIRASNSGGYAETTLTISVSAYPANNLNYGSSFYSLTVNSSTSFGPFITLDTPTYSISPALPSGLSLDTTNGIISGVPNVLSSARAYTVTATDASGTSTSSVLTIQVVEAPPTAFIYDYDTTSFTFEKDTAITPLVPIIGGGAPTSYTIYPTLPTGLLLNTATGVISGTPTVLSGNNAYAVKAINTGGSYQQNISISIPNSTPRAISYGTNTIYLTCNTAMSPFYPTVLGGVPNTYTFTGTLQQGLFIEPSSGILFGTPTVCNTTRTIVVTGSNSVGSATRSVTVITYP